MSVRPSVGPLPIQKDRRKWTHLIARPGLLFFVPLAHCRKHCSVLPHLASWQQTPSLMTGTSPASSQMVFSKSAFEAHAVSLHNTFHFGQHSALFTASTTPERVSDNLGVDAFSKCPEIQLLLTFLKVIFAILMGNNNNGLNHEWVKGLEMSLLATFLSLMIMKMLMMMMMILMMMRRTDLSQPVWVARPDIFAVCKHTQQIRDSMSLWPLYDA